MFLKQKCAHFARELQVINSLTLGTRSPASNLSFQRLHARGLAVCGTDCATTEVSA